MGAATYLEVLTAQQVAEASRMDLSAAQAQRLIDTDSFYSSMGGGWEDDADRASTENASFLILKTPNPSEMTF
jgi:outer membrane protein TolC